MANTNLRTVPITFDFMGACHFLAFLAYPGEDGANKRTIFIDSVLYRHSRIDEYSEEAKKYFRSMISDKRRNIIKMKETNSSFRAITQKINKRIINARVYIEHYIAHIIKHIDRTKMKADELEFINIMEQKLGIFHHSIQMPLLLNSEGARILQYPETIANVPQYLAEQARKTTLADLQEAIWDKINVEQDAPRSIDTLRKDHGWQETKKAMGMAIAMSNIWKSEDDHITDLINSWESWLIPAIEESQRFIDISGQLARLKNTSQQLPKSLHILPETQRRPFLVMDHALLTQ